MNLVSEDFVKKHNLLYLVKIATFKLVGITGMPLQVLGVIRVLMSLLRELFSK